MSSIVAGTSGFSLNLPSSAFSNIFLIVLLNTLPLLVLGNLPLINPDNVAMPPTSMAETLR